MTKENTDKINHKMFYVFAPAGIDIPGLRL